jgi:nucleoside-diphosphate-sugar epimerase
MSGWRGILLCGWPSVWVVISWEVAGPANGSNSWIATSLTAVRTSVVGPHVDVRRAHDATGLGRVDRRVGDASFAHTVDSEVWMGVERIAVTGGTGKAGRAVLADLRSAGLEAVDVDVATSRSPDAPTLLADLTDLGQALEALYGFDAVVHLAAIPAPGIHTDGETFRINVLSTYNVFSAAAKLGLEKVVWASSETLIGLPFQREQPRYAPIDEDHPRLPESHYALSKLVGEEIAEQFSRWSGVPFTALRISNIMEPADYQRFPGFWDDPSIRAWNLWGYVDARDVAQAARLALTNAQPETEAYLVAAADTCMTTSSADLLNEIYPDVPTTRPIEGHETLLSIDKAKTQLGFQPNHSWRDHVNP